MYQYTRESFMYQFSLFTRGSACVCHLIVHIHVLSKKSLHHNRMIQYSVYYKKEVLCITYQTSIQFYVKPITPMCNTSYT